MNLVFKPSLNYKTIYFLIFLVIVNLLIWYFKKETMLLSFAGLFSLPFSMLLSLNFSSYEITATELKIKVPFDNKNIAFSEIRNVKMVKRPLFFQVFLANPMQMVEISYTKYDSVLVQPDNVNEFLKTLGQKVSIEVLDCK